MQQAEPPGAPPPPGGKGKSKTMYGETDDWSSNQPHNAFDQMPVSDRPQAAKAESD